MPPFPWSRHLILPLQNSRNSLVSQVNICSKGYTSVHSTTTKNMFVSKSQKARVCFPHTKRIIIMSSCYHRALAMPSCFFAWGPQCLTFKTFPPSLKLHWNWSRLWRLWQCLWLHPHLVSKGTSVPPKSNPLHDEMWSNLHVRWSPEIQWKGWYEPHWGQIVLLDARALMPWTHRLGLGSWREDSGNTEKYYFDFLIQFSF